MKILIIIGSFKAGGAERMSINIGEELMKRGYDIHYILQQAIFEIPHSIPDNKITVLRSNQETGKIKILHTLFTGVYRESNRIKPDVIIGFSRFSSFLANFTFHPRIIARLDAYPYRMNLKQRIWADTVLSSPKIKKVVVPSSDMVEALINKRTFAKSKFYLLPNSINPAEVLRKSKLENIKYDFEYITAMGRLSVQKNFELLIRAYSESNLKCKLIIIGEGEHRSTLERLVNKQGLKGRVILAGRINNPFPLIANSKFFANASLFEGLSNVILEALILGKAVIATNCHYGSADMVIDNYNGFLVKNNDINDMTEKLNLLYNNVELVKKFENNAASSVEKFNIKNVGDKWEEVLIKVVEPNQH